MTITLNEREMRQAIVLFLRDNKDIKVQEDSLVFNCVWNQDYDTKPHDFEVSFEQ